ncbi:MAG: DNA methyltransferase [Methanocorpusculum sp.]|nr:DNA methyltransferase [Methanocorpusculum sp.]
MKKRELKISDLDRVRSVEGFPIGKDEKLIELSDSPNYTVFPNVFINEYIAENGTPYTEETDSYQCEPFATDVSEGKSDSIYNAHTYHTKVPYKAIMRYILHYTKPGDIVLDGFCGTGMTGVAANMCAHPEAEFKRIIEHDMPQVQWGKRFPILNDLSPIATFISKNYNADIDVTAFEREAEEVLKLAYAECGWMYKTGHDDGYANMPGIASEGEIIYTVWSDVFICPNCGEEIVFYNAAADPDTGKVSDEFCCASCGVKLKKKDCEMAVSNYFDEALGTTKTIVKQKPVLINYQYGKKRFTKVPDKNDLEVIERIEQMKIPYWFPIDRLCEGKESRRNDKIGLTHVHHFFYKRTLYVLSKLFDLIEKSQHADLLRIMFTSQIINISKMNRFRPQVSFPYNPLSGTMYVSSMISEANPFNAYTGKVKKFADALKYNKNNSYCISTGSTTQLQMSDNSCDYIFTDPPFGDNLNYSELSFLWESWLGAITNSKYEAIVNPTMGKALPEYQELMTRCFSEYYRVLKPNRWMTVEFHNSKNAVWNAIQEALQKAGFIVADVRTLDKQGSSFKQITNASAVKQDLVISVYKPKDSFQREMLNNAGTEETAWAFVRQHLANIPVIVRVGDKLEIISERQAFLLFDRMVAFHIMQGLPIPVDSSDFYRGLDEKFLKRDGMYFLPDQVNEYDTARIITDIEPIQFSLFVTNEKTAISWLYQQLSDEYGGPKTYAEIQPKFMQEVKAVDKYEEMPELQTILEENFIKDENGRWYIPDVTKEGDVAKLREKNLLKEFEGYMASKGKLKLFRSEAIRVGFSKLWKEKNYKAIVELADRLPEATVQEDSNILMYYDISLGRV